MKADLWVFSQHARLCCDVHPMNNMCGQCMDTVSSLDVSESLISIPQLRRFAFFSSRFRGFKSRVACFRSDRFASVISGHANEPFLCSKNVQLRFVIRVACSRFEAFNSPLQLAGIGSPFGHEPRRLTLFLVNNEERISFSQLFGTRKRSPLLFIDCAPREHKNPAQPRSLSPARVPSNEKWQKMKYSEEREWHLISNLIVNSSQRSLSLSPSLVALSSLFIILSQSIAPSSAAVVAAIAIITSVQRNRMLAFPKENDQQS